MSNQDKIKELKKELAKYSKKDETRLKYIKEQQEIADLKKQIRSKKYAGVVQVGKNLKTIGKALGKAGSKFVGQEPLGKDGKRKHKTVEEMMKDLPQ